MKTSLLATLVLCAAMSAQDTVTQTDTPVVTTLTTIRKTPEAFTNVTVQFTVQFASLGRISNPFFTRFTPAEFANFYAWADEQPLWQRASYDDVFGNLFYAKSGAQLQEVYGLTMYERLSVTGVVRNTFQSMPFIEVTSFTKLSDQINSASLAHMYRGEQHMSERRWQRAIAELTLAPVGGVPATLRSAAYKNLGICHLRIGETEQAKSYLQMAQSLTTTTDTELDDLLTTSMTTPGKELDRVVGMNGPRDSERPMWEAFETSAPTTTGTTRTTTGTTGMTTGTTRTTTGTTGTTTGTTTTTTGTTTGTTPATTGTTRTTTGTTTTTTGTTTGTTPTTTGTNGTTGTTTGTTRTTTGTTRTTAGKAQSFL